MERDAGFYLETGYLWKRKKKIAKVEPGTKLRTDETRITIESDHIVTRESDSIEWSAKSVREVPTFFNPIKRGGILGVVDLILLRRIRLIHKS